MFMILLYGPCTLAKFSEKPPETMTMAILVDVTKHLNLDVHGDGTKNPEAETSGTTYE